MSTLVKSCWEWVNFWAWVGIPTSPRDSGCASGGTFFPQFSLGGGPPTAIPHPGVVWGLVKRSLVGDAENAKKKKKKKNLSLPGNSSYPHEQCRVVCTGSKAKICTKNMRGYAQKMCHPERWGRVSYRTSHHPSTFTTKCDDGFFVQKEELIILITFQTTFFSRKVWSFEGSKILCTKIFI